MEPHITVTASPYDEDLLQAVFTVCDGSSQFINSTYIGHDWLERQSAALATFSRQVHGGIYTLEAGEGGPEYAGGAFKARFHYHKPTELFISTFQQSDYIEYKRTQVASEAKLYLRTEPGLL